MVKLVNGVGGPPAIESHSPAAHAAVAIRCEDDVTPVAGDARRDITSGVRRQLHAPGPVGPHDPDVGGAARADVDDPPIRVHAGPSLPARLPSVLPIMGNRAELTGELYLSPDGWDANGFARTLV